MSTAVILSPKMLQSNRVKFLAPDSLANRWYVVWRGKFPLFTFSFNFVRSTQILTLSFLFGTKTIGADNSLGFLISMIIPSSCNFCNTNFTISCKGNAILRSVNTAYGLASSFSWILHSEETLLRPVQSSGKLILKTFDIFGDIRHCIHSLKYL